MSARERSLERMCKRAIAELGSAIWYPGYTTQQPRSIELMRRYFDRREKAEGGSISSPERSEAVT